MHVTLAETLIADVDQPTTLTSGPWAMQDGPCAATFDSRMFWQLVGNIRIVAISEKLELLRPDFHHVVLDWTNKYGGFMRARILWYDGLVVTDPVAVGQIVGRGEGALDKASPVYIPINQMCTPRAHPNLLTSPADPAWRAVRKAVAAAFSVNNIRKKYPVIHGVSQQLVQQLVSLSQKSEDGAIIVDMDQAALRVTLDVIGLAGFDHNFHCVENACVTEPAPPQHLLRVLPRCFTEVMLRLINPLRPLFPKRFAGAEKGDRAIQAFQKEMRALLRDCLLRPTPPAADDITIGAQLWRAYHEQQPPPPPLPPPHTHSTTSTTTSSSGAGVVPTATSSSKDGDGSGAGLSPLKTSCSNGNGSNSGGGSSVGDEDVTIGGLLPPPPTYWQKVQLVLRDMKRILAGLYGPTETEKDRHVECAKLGQSNLLLSAERLLGEIGILFIEGFETTGHTIGWTLLNIATVPGVQQRIVHELAEHHLLATQAADGTVSLPHIDMDQLHSLTYLTACVKEAMRMLPVVSVMARKVGPEPVRVGPYLIPAHTPVAIPLFAIQNSRHNWENADEYRPDRWLKVPAEAYVVGSMPSLPVRSRQGSDGGASMASSSTPTSTSTGIMSAWEQVHACAPAGAEEDVTHKARHAEISHEPLLHMSPAASETSDRTSGSLKHGSDSDSGLYSHKRGGEVRFMPFSEGPRNCVGQTLAKMEVITVLTQVLGSFSVELASEMGGREGVRARESTHLTLQTKGIEGLRFVLRPRWQV